VWLKFISIPARPDANVEVRKLHHGETEMFVLTNRKTRMHARFDSIGEHDGKVTDDVGSAKEFDTFGEASEFSQNFGDDWKVGPTHDLHQPVPMMPADFHRSYRHDY
jgi:hypothetical protein